MEDQSIQSISGYGEWEVPRDELRVMDILGSGAFGDVRRAKWRGTVVAVKTSNSVSEGADEFKVDFLSLTKLHHPNIVQLLGACTDTAPYMICMEFVPFSLDRMIYRLDYPQRLSISADVARALAYLHNRKPNYIIHRDVKPQNILLTASMKAKVTDFGISLFRTDKTSPYKMTGETGTYRYMAPEVLRSEKYDHKVDIWSFGMVMYHMFENTPPYENLEPAAMMRAIGRNVIPNLNNEVTRTMISTCLKITPMLRIEALDLVDTIESIRFPDFPPAERKVPTGCFPCISF
tara:strand:- start:1562 stop:2434 length:873 start_codon:yes stop_codon:yes gene_type:complete